MKSIFHSTSVQSAPAASTGQAALLSCLFLLLALLLSACAGPAQPSGVQAAGVNLAIQTPSPTDTPASEESAPVRPSPTTVATELPATSTPTPVPPPTATATTVVEASAPFVTLSGFSHMWQTFNNCGPATLAMNLSYFGSTLGQADIRAILRPNGEDKNVSPVELASYARSQGYHALVRVNGNADRLRALLSNGIPVIIETWLEPHPNDGLGHYRLLIGYDDEQQHWIGFDSYYRENMITGGDGSYQGIRMPYAETDSLWRVFNRTHVIIYTPDQAPQVAAILGSDLDDAVMWQRALADAEAEVAARPEDGFAWFNLGTDLTALGRFGEAADAYDRARRFGLPPRMLWYQFGPFQAYHGAGRHGDLLSLADGVLRPAVQIEEIHFWKAEAQAALGDEAAAQASRQRIQVLNSNFQPDFARLVVHQVTQPQPQAAEAQQSPATVASVTSPPVEFVADVTVPDYTRLTPDESFEKTWRVRNVSDQTWQGYTVRPIAGTINHFGGPDALPLPATGPGATVDISLPLVAPREPGQYTSYWQIQTADGTPVSGGQLWMVVEVAP